MLTSSSAFPRIGAVGSEMLIRGLLIKGSAHTQGNTVTYLVGEFDAFKKEDFIYLFLERRRKKERERNINVWLPLMCHPLGIWPTTQACALDQELNQRPFGLQAGTQSAEPHQPGWTV